VKQALYQKRLVHYRIQRQRERLVIALLLLIVLLQSIALYFRHERIIIHPPELTQHYWVEGNRFSPSYLQEMARYFCHLLLDVNPIQIKTQGEIALSYASPEAYGALKAQLLADEQRLRQQQASLHFAPKDIVLDMSQLTATVTGELHRYVGHKKIDSDLSTWQIAFLQRKGRLFIKSFEPVVTPSEKK